jgi:type II secretory pathway pseudopilin PulG
MKKSNLKNRLSAFTLVELVFIIIVIGILASVIVPRAQSSRLREAADQIVSHIRYTQHLAMMDDKFDPEDNDWYKKRWQILFDQDGDDFWTYTIFSDDDADGIIDEEEIARNPQDTSKRLVGRKIAGISDNVITKEVNLGKVYGIKGTGGIVFTNCGDGNQRIVFDYLGRPMRGNPKDYDRPYRDTYLITNLCTMTITDSSSDSLRIIIQPETGFANITR